MTFIPEPAAEGQKGRAMSEETTEEVQKAVAGLVARSSELQSEVVQRHERIGVLRARLEALAGRVAPGSSVDVADSSQSALAALPDGASPSAAPSPKRPVSRRRMLALTGAGIAGGAVAAAVSGASPAGANMVLSPSALGPRPGTKVVEDASDAAAASTPGMVYVPAPTGVAATDTANILKALSQATAGSTVVLQCRNTKAVYVINQELPVPEGVRVTAPGVNDEQPFPSSVNGYMATLQQQSGTSLLCVMASAGYLAGLYGPSNPGKYSQYNSLYNNGNAKSAADSAIEVDHLAFDGQNGGMLAGNTAGHALVLYSNGSRSTTVTSSTPTGRHRRRRRQLRRRGGSGPFLDNRIYDNKMFNTGSQGILGPQHRRLAGLSQRVPAQQRDRVALKQTASTPAPDGLGVPNFSPSTSLPYGGGAYWTTRLDGGSSTTTPTRAPDPAGCVPVSGGCTSPTTAPTPSALSPPTAAAMSAMTSCSAVAVHHSIPHSSTAIRCRPTRASTATTSPPPTVPRTTPIPISTTG